MEQYNYAKDNHNPGGDRRAFLGVIRSAIAYCLLPIDNRYLFEGSDGNSTNPPVEAFLISHPDIHGNFVALAIGNHPDHGAMAQVIVTDKPTMQKGQDGNSRVILGDAIRINPVHKTENNSIIDATPLTLFQQQVVPERPDGSNNYFIKNLYEGDVQIVSELFGPDGEKEMLNRYGTLSEIGKVVLSETTPSMGGETIRTCQIKGPDGAIIFESKMQIARTIAKPAVDTPTGSSWSTGLPVADIQFDLGENEKLDLPKPEMLSLKEYVPNGTMTVIDGSSKDIPIRLGFVATSSLLPSVRVITVDKKMEQPLFDNALIKFYKAFITTARANKSEYAGISIGEYATMIKEVSNGKRPVSDIVCQIEADTLQRSDSVYRPEKVLVCPFVPDNIPMPKNVHRIKQVAYELQQKSQTEQETHMKQLNFAEGPSMFVGSCLYDDTLVIRCQYHEATNPEILKEIVHYTDQFLTNGRLKPDMGQINKIDSRVFKFDN